MTNGAVTNTPHHSDGEENINLTSTSSKIYFEITQDDVDDDDVILRDVRSTPKKSKQRSNNVDDKGDQQEESRDHIKRPLNAFMIWAQEKRKIIMGKRPKMHNAEISRMLGAHWRELSESEKDVYRDQAVNLKDLHRVAYPNYKFRPRKRTRKRRRSGNAKTEASPSKSQRKDNLVVDTTKVKSPSPTMDNQENSTTTTCFTHEVELIRDQHTRSPQHTKVTTTKVLHDHSSNQQPPPPQKISPTPANLIYVPVHHPTPTPAASSEHKNICHQQPQRNSAAKLYLVPIKSKLMTSSPAITSSSCHNDSHHHHQMKTVYITTSSHPSLLGEKQQRSATTSLNNNVVVTSRRDDVIIYGDDMEQPPALVKPFTEDFLPLQELFSLEANKEDAMDGVEGCKGKMDVDWAYVDMEVFQGNEDSNIPVAHNFPTEITARYFRIIVVTWNAWPCLRFDFLTC